MDTSYTTKHKENQWAMNRTQAKRNDQQMIPATHTNRLRERIRVGMIMDRFQKCINGEIELTSQQVACGKVLLNKVLPDAIAPKESADSNIKDVTCIPTWKLLEAIEGEIE